MAQPENTTSQRQGDQCQSLVTSDNGNGSNPVANHEHEASEVDRLFGELTGRIEAIIRSELSGERKDKIADDLMAVMDRLLAPEMEDQQIGGDVGGAKGLEGEGWLEDGVERKGEEKM